AVVNEWQSDLERTAGPEGLLSAVGAFVELHADLRQPPMDGCLLLLSWKSETLESGTQMAFAQSRSTNFWILPVDVFGRSVKSTVLGTLNAARCCLQNSMTLASSVC